MLMVNKYTSHDFPVASFIDHGLKNLWKSSLEKDVIESIKLTWLMQPVWNYILEIPTFPVIRLSHEVLFPLSKCSFYEISNFKHSISDFLMI